MTDLLNIIFDAFGTRLLDYRNELVLCISQGHSFISTVWLWSTEEYRYVFVFIYFNEFKWECM